MRSEETKAAIGIIGYITSYKPKAKKRDSRKEKERAPRPESSAKWKSRKFMMNQGLILKRREDLYRAVKKESRNRLTALTGERTFTLSCPKSKEGNMERGRLNRGNRYRLILS